MRNEFAMSFIAARWRRTDRFGNSAGSRPATAGAPSPIFPGCDSALNAFSQIAWAASPAARRASTRVVTFDCKAASDVLASAA
jgi:hypothetical protein